MNWVKDEVIEIITGRINTRTELLNLAEIEILKYNDKTKTADKYEAAFFEYWRTVKVLASNEIQFLQSMLKDIRSMELEEIEEYEELYKG